MSRASLGACPIVKASGSHVPNRLLYAIQSSADLQGRTPSCALRLLCVSACIFACLRRGIGVKF